MNELNIYIDILGTEEQFSEKDIDEYFVLD